MDRARRLTLVLVAMAVLLSGCTLSNLQFHGDHRLTFTAPGMRQKVTAPVTISWTMQDFDPTGLDGGTSKGQGVYAVFVDTSPMPVGKDLLWLFRDDPGSTRDPRYVTTARLNKINVYLTTDPTLMLTARQLPLLPAGVGDEEHTVNVVLLDGTGTRRTESAWFRTFLTKRRETT